MRKVYLLGLCILFLCLFSSGVNAAELSLQLNTGRSCSSGTSNYWYGQDDTPIGGEYWQWPNVNNQRGGVIIFDEDVENRFTLLYGADWRDEVTIKTVRWEWSYYDKEGSMYYVELNRDAMYDQNICANNYFSQWQSGDRISTSMYTGGDCAAGRYCYKLTSASTHYFDLVWDAAIGADDDWYSMYGTGGTRALINITYEVFTFGFNITQPLTNQLFAPTENVTIGWANSTAGCYANVSYAIDVENYTNIANNSQNGTYDIGVLDSGTHELFMNFSYCGGNEIDTRQFHVGEGIDDCTIFNITLIDIQFLNEEDLTETVYSDYQAIFFTSPLSYNYSTAGYSNNFSLCSSTNFTTTLIETIIQYENDTITTTGSFQPRDYFAIYNITGYKDVELYLLNESKSTNLEVEVTDQNTVVLSDYYVEFYRFYTGDNVYRMVDSCITDINGICSVDIDISNVLYQIRIRNRQDQLIYTSATNQINDNPLSIQVPLGVDKSLQILNEIIEDLTYSLTADEVIRIINLSWTDTEGLISRACLHIQTANVSGFANISWECNSLSSGSLSYNYSGQPREDSIAWYKMDDNLSTRNVIDEKGHYDGIADNYTVNLSVNGKIDLALKFNGVNDYIDLPSALDSALTKEFTISVWINRTNNTANSGIVGFGTAADRKIYIFNGDNQINLQVENSSGNLQTTTINYFNNSTWDHIAARYNGEVISLYFNGILTSAETAQTGNLVSVVYHYVGKIEGFNNWNGSIDDLRIYNRALSETEISNLYSLSEAPLGHVNVNNTNLLASFYVTSAKDGNLYKILDLTIQNIKEWVSWRGNELFLSLMVLGTLVGIGVATGSSIVAAIFGVFGLFAVYMMGLIAVKGTVVWGFVIAVIFIIVMTIKKT